MAVGYDEDILTGWLAGLSENRKTDEYARDLITESITLYEELHDSRKVAEARAELAQCYWRTGANDEARILLSTALARLAETLVIQGIALARMRESARAQFIFQQAIEVAHEAGSLNCAGLAALTMIEEIETLPRDVQSVAFEQAQEWLGSSQSPDIKPRLKTVRRKLTAQRQSKPQPIDVREVLFNKRHDLEKEVLKCERNLVSEALAKVNGKVTHAAKLLGVGYQRLAYIIETRHPDLLKKRTPVRRRPRRKKPRR